MGGELGWPETESVMVFGSEDHALHSGFFEGLHPLAGIELGWVEASRILVTFAPLFSAKGVWSEMDEAVVHHLVPGELARGGGWSGLCGGHCGE